MLYSLKLFLRDKWITLPLLAVILAQIFIWWLILSSFDFSSGRIFLHYNIIFGVDLVGDWWKILNMPLGGLLVLSVNYFLSLVFYRSDRFLSRLLGFWTLLIHIFLAVSVFLLVRINV